MTITVKNLAGTWPAIVTPFSKEGTKIDYESLSKLLEFQIAGGVSGIVVCGSTGEAATLSDEEYRTVIAHTVKSVAKRVPVVAGIGSNNTARAVEMAKLLTELKVDGILLVVPPYNKPTHEGLVAHFSEVHRASPLPIIAYNVPGRTGLNMLPKTVAVLVEKNLIVGLKEACGSIDQVLDLVALVGDRLAILSGEDSLTHATMACSGKGVISVLANALPKEVSELTAAGLRGDWDTALKAQIHILPACRAMFMETNPIPVKTLMAMRGIIAHPTLRLPLVPAQAETVAKLKSVMAIYE
jgi:4-hydroxy-tetrahydrodipicolinate synthase